MSVRRVAAALLLLTGCPDFPSDAQYRCVAASDCASGARCVDGQCCAAPSCGDRCGGVATNACGESIECPRCCEPLICGAQCGVIRDACQQEVICRCREMFVDATARPGGDGSERAPFRALSSAFSAIDEAGAVIHVAPGDYDSGVSAPLELFGGVELIGAGSDVTRITGVAGLRRPTFAADHVARAAVEIGHSARRNVLRGVTLRSSTPDTGPFQLTAGIACTAGTSSGTPNTLIEDVRVEGTFDVGLYVTTADAETAGCHASVRSATITGTRRHGIFLASECLLRRTSVALELSDATISDIGSRFDHPDVQGIEKVGIAAWDCVRRATLDRVTIARAQLGLAIATNGPHAAYPPQASEYRVRDSRILEHTIAGIRIERDTKIVELRGTLIAGNRSPEAMTTAYGIHILGNVTAWPHYPAIELARDNRIVGNDFGIFVASARGVHATSDFGREGEDGMNVIQCNSNGLAGRDLLVVDTASLAAGAELLFEGNAWDHAPPTRSDQRIDGVDLDAPRAALPRVARARASSSTCTPPQVPGPR